MATSRQKLQSHPKGWARTTVAASCWQIQKLRHSQTMCPRSEQGSGRGTPPRRLPALRLLPARWPPPVSHVKATGRQHIGFPGTSLCGGGPSKGVLQHNQGVITHQHHKQPLSLSAAKLVIKSCKGIPKGTNMHLSKLA